MIKKICMLCISLVYFISAAMALAASPAVISVYDNVTISKSEILLGDIAQISCDDANRAAELSAMKLGTIPVPGQKILLSSRVFELRTRSSGVNCDDISWTIPDTITISTDSQTIASDVLSQMGQKAITDQLKSQQDKREYTVEVLTVPKPMLVPAGTIAYDLSIPFGVKFVVPTSVYIWVNIDGQPYKKALFRAKVHMYESVVVTNRVMAAGELVTPDDIHVEKKEINALLAGYMTDSKKPIGFIMKRMTNSGTVLAESMLDKPVILKMGSMIHITAKMGDANVQTQGIALQDGKNGQVIRVRNTVTKKIVSGTVIDADTVQVAA
jgi:flagella basal body P-ring formation protein FlgA